MNEPMSKQPRVKTKDIKSFFTSGSSSNGTKAGGKGGKATKSKGGKGGGSTSTTRVYPMAIKTLSVKRATTII